MLSSNKRTTKNTCLEINQYLSQMYQDQTITHSQLSELAKENMEAMRSQNYEALLHTVAEVYRKTDSMAAGEVLSLIYQETSNNY